MYRGTWLLVGIPLLIAAFTVFHPQPLPRADAATGLRRHDRDGRPRGQFAQQHPEPRSRHAGDAVAAATGSPSGSTIRPGASIASVFTRKSPAAGDVQLENLLAVRQGRSNQT